VFNIAFFTLQFKKKDLFLERSLAFKELKEDKSAILGSPYYVATGGTHQ